MKAVATPSPEAQAPALEPALEASTFQSAWTPEPTHFTPAAITTEITRSEDGQQWLPHAVVDRNPYQPRVSFDEAELADLCDSIRTHGFLQPIVVRPHGRGYQIVAAQSPGSTDAGSPSTSRTS